MKIRLEIDGDAFDVDLERTPDGFVATCEGERCPLSLVASDDAVRLRSEGVEVRVEVPSDDRANVGGRPVEYALLRYEPGNATAQAASNGGTPVHAVMPGRLVRVLVHAGQAVQKGQPLFILEAMKMQNELGSPLTGVVAELLAKEGDVVESGRRLARIEGAATSRKA